MDRWEYLVLTVARDDGDEGGIVKALNGEVLKNWRRRRWILPDALSYCGERGWELVSTIRRRQGQDGESYYDCLYIFKRLKQEA